MSITVQWDNDEKTIVRWDFNGPWDWEQYSQAQQQNNAFICSVPHVVDIIGDVRNSPTLPANAVTVYRNSLQSNPPNIGLIVLVGTSRFVRSMVEVFSTVFRLKKPGSQFQFADSLDEARALLEARRRMQQTG